MQRSESLRRMALEFYAAINTRDLTTVRDLHADAEGNLGIGTDEAEWFDGTDAIVEAFGQQFDAVPGFTILPGEVTAYEEGTVGWIADRPTVHVPDGGTWQGRLTAVARRVDGRWLSVQHHLSVARAEG